MTDCVAYYFNMHPDKVPYFIANRPHTGWARRLREYYKRRGFKARWIETTSVPKRGLHLVTGDSLTFEKYAHAVMYKDGKLVYDPAYPSSWKDCRITHRLEVTKL